jgi:tRNA(Ile2) C34 agmatinyltransferase TiaS
MPENPQCTNPGCNGETMVRIDSTSSQGSTQWQFRCPKCERTTVVSDPPFTKFTTAN